MRTVAATGLLLFAIVAPEFATAQPTSVYYEGTTQITLPGGRTIPGGPALAKRTTDPSTGIITEQVINPASGNRPAAEYIVTATVKDAHFTMTEASGAFEGEGTLVGPAWHWTGWSSVSRLKDGMRVESTDSATATTLKVHKRVIGADGVEQVTTTETFNVVDEARFLARRKEMLTPQAPVKL